MSDNDLIQKGQDDLIRRGDALALFLAIDDLRHMNVGQATVLFAERRAALIALPAVQPTVKPLVWFETADGGETCLTDERYSISYWEGEKLFVDRYTTMRRHPTLEAAKAAAQADYDARILSALDMQPTVSPELLATTHDVAALEKILSERGAVFDAMVDAAEDAAGKDVSFNVVIGRALRAALARVKSKEGFSNEKGVM